MHRKLTENFTLAELCKTNTGHINLPNETQIANLKTLCENILQPVRERIDMPIVVTSGYRSERVNKAVGGAPFSQHRTGEAVDIKCYDNMLLFKELVKLGNYDQLIYEKGSPVSPAWIHVSYKNRGNRRQLLICK